MSKLFLVIFLLLIISCEKEVSVSPPDQLPYKGKIVINSNPNDFLIFLNNKNRARYTNDSISWLKDDEYQITLKKKFFRDSTFSQTIIDENTYNLFIDFEKNQAMKGKLQVNSLPEKATIFINDSNTFKTTPYNFENLMPGKYIIKLKLSNHLEEVGEVIVESSKSTTMKKGLIDTTIWKKFTKDEFIHLENSMTDIEFDNFGNMFIGTRNGLITYDGSWHYLNPENSPLPHKVINDIQIDVENNIWVATSNGFALVKDNQVKMKYLSNGLTGPLQITSFPTDNINTLLVNEDLPFLFGTNIGIGYADQKLGELLYRFTHYKERPRELVVHFSKTANVNSIIKFNNEFLIGTSGEGLLITDFEYIIVNSYKKYNRYNYAMPSNNIGSMCKDNNDGVWILFNPDISTPRSSLTYLKEGNFNHNTFGANEPKLNSIFVDSRNIIWVGTINGLYIFNEIENRFLINNETVGVDLGDVKRINEDSDKKIWITSNKGLFKINNVQKLLNLYL